ncbi:D-3-phosphoglycerate dehydrogenase [Terribacillus halophilus]|uniref:D-3-phosphoglycerate dehydrogenase n=1 Tax=Terribacillus halophilus TaxID=361279 RepID=A0A1G6T531_9BACI|nr:phosphoglycerate dehydrogenase [Terribacillus halophilus]SDD23475.1 D-3-phosphoglycerate dehydrogenase [Terribacillus halophilus]
MLVVSTSPSFAKYSNEPIELLKKNGIELKLLPADISEEDFIKEAKDAQAAIVAFNSINEHVLSQLPGLKIVCKHGVGIDNIDVKAAARNNVIITNVPNANKHAVADYAFALILSLARDIPRANQLTKNGEWPRVFGSDVYGKSLGILGTGQIGREVAKRAKGFSMEVLAYDPFPDEQFASAYDVKYVDLQELLQSSDYVTMHLPLLPETKHLIAEKELKLMKESAFLINASRGGVVSEQALYQALSNGWIKGAALDVFEEEPLVSHPLFELDNVLALPHIAGYTPGAVNKLSVICAENVIAVLKGFGIVKHKLR